MSLQFYQDKPHECPYLDGKQARNLYPDPHQPLSKALYSKLIAHGFRRSGDHAYRPFCDDCKACVPVRINIADFKPNRSQRRCLNNNSDVSVKVRPAEYNPEHFELYCRYISSRHAGGGMDEPTIDKYLSFLTSNWCDTAFIELRLEKQLIGVAVTDFIDNGSSAFYTFFDPELSKRSLGTFAILKQIELCKSHQLPWLYLGYWIEECQKMSYKSNFSALEGYDQNWQKITLT